MKAALLASIVLAIPSYAAAGLRCGDRVVSDGSSTFEVKARCGDPVYVDSTLEARTIRSFHPRIGYVEQRRTVEVQRWTYVLDSKKLIRIAVFENGTLLKVRTAGRPPAREGDLAQCKDSVLTDGDTAGEVHLHCGEPDDKHRWFEELAAGNLGIERRELIPYERWIYNFGPRRFLRILTFRNGRLIKQATGGYGW